MLAIRKETCNSRSAHPHLKLLQGMQVLRWQPGSSNVTGPAVSQQIRNLESNLGVSLFHRSHRAVQLTDRGRLFQNSVSVALTHLANAVDEVRIEDDADILDVVTDTSIAAMWLMPRLHRFQAQNPQCLIRLSTTDVEADLLE